MASKPRWFFAAMPVPEDLARLQERIADAGIFDQLGRRMFAPENWHQTLSDRFWEPDEATRAALMRAGERLQAIHPGLQAGQMVPTLLEWQDLLHLGWRQWGR